MPLFAFFYECPVKVVNVFSLKRVVCFFLFFFRVSYFTFPPPRLKGAVIINTSEKSSIYYHTQILLIYVSELFVFSLFFSPPSLLIAHVLVGVWWCVTVIALP